MNRCAGFKRDGTPCALSARGSSSYCWAHDPDTRLQRSENAAKGGRARVGGDIVEVKTRLRDVAEGVLNGTVDKGRGSVAFQGFGVLIRAIEAERKIKEQDELVERLEALERVAEARRGSAWGA